MENLKFELGQIFHLLNKIYNWEAKYLFDEHEKWGMELDWRRILHTNPDSTNIHNFVKLLITTNVLVINQKIKKNNKEYITYKLHRSYKKRIRSIIELTPEYSFLDTIYSIYE